MIAAADIGAFATAAFAYPARFHGQSVDLAAETLTINEIAARLFAGVGQTVTANSLPKDEALASGIHPSVVGNQLWANAEGYSVDVAITRAWGVPLTSFDQWVYQHRDEFVIG